MSEADDERAEKLKMVLRPAITALVFFILGLIFFIPWYQAEAPATQVFVAWKTAGTEVAPRFSTWAGREGKLVTLEEFQKSMNNSPIRLFYWHEWDDGQPPSWQRRPDKWELNYSGQTPGLGKIFAIVTIPHESHFTYEVDAKFDRKNVEFTVGSTRFYPFLVIPGFLCLLGGIFLLTAWLGIRD